MNASLGSLMVVGTVLTALAGAPLQGSIIAANRATERAPAGPSPLAYVIAGAILQFGALDLSSGDFRPIGPSLPLDVGAGLVQGLGTSLLTLAFSGKLDAIDPFTGQASVVGPTGLRDCSAPGSYDPNCANVLGRVGGSFYATDFANNLYSVNPATGAATLIGATGMPALTFAPFSQNADGTFNVFSENFVSVHGRLYANFATATTDFATVTPVIPGALYQIDPSTGRATWIAPTDTNITAMVNVNDTVYAFDVYTNQVLTLDLNTGQTTPERDIDPAVMHLVAGATAARPSPAAVR
jgi:hypothetical protein